MAFYALFSGLGLGCAGLGTIIVWGYTMHNEIADGQAQLAQHIAAPTTPSPQTVQNTQDINRLTAALDRLAGIMDSERVQQGADETRMTKIEAQLDQLQRMKGKP